MVPNGMRCNRTIVRQVNNFLPSTSSSTYIMFFFYAVCYSLKYYLVFIGGMNIPYLSYLKETGTVNPSPVDRGSAAASTSKTFLPFFLITRIIRQENDFWCALYNATRIA